MATLSLKPGKAALAAMKLEAHQRKIGMPSAAPAAPEAATRSASAKPSDPAARPAAAPGGSAAPVPAPPGQLARMDYHNGHRPGEPADPRRSRD